MTISALLTAIVSLSAILLSSMALLSKTSFEIYFMTTEQILKKRLFDTLGIVLYLSFLSPFIYIVWNIYVKKLEFGAINWRFTLSISITTFLISSVLILFYAKPVRNIMIKDRIMYKVNLDDLGELYIIKMLDQETCICSPNSNIDLNDSNSQIYLIKMDNLMKIPILKEIVPLPPTSIYKKLFS